MPLPPTATCWPRPRPARCVARPGPRPGPDRPIRILVPYTPGAFNDTLARLIGERMQDAVGQIGVVENRPGASGSLAIAATAQATGPPHHRGGQYRQPDDEPLPLRQYRL